MLKMICAGAIILSSFLPMVNVSGEDLIKSSSELFEGPCRSFCEVTGGIPHAGISLVLAQADFSYPTDEEIEYMAKVIHGEADGCSDLQKSGVAWCVCNRVDWFEYPNNVIDVITQYKQFHGYTPDKVPNESDYRIAEDVLVRWYYGLPGRTLPSEYLYFHSNGKGYNIFTTDHRAGKEWNWSLSNIYEEE